jgi:hypothetical protein
MAAAEHRRESAGVDLGIERRRRQVLVPQQLLHLADVGAALQEMRRVGLTQHVG